MRRLSAIMFTDMVGYTALMGADEPKALTLLERSHTILRPLINRFHGEWLQVIGDGTLSRFDSAVDAVNCARKRQVGLRGPLPDIARGRRRGLPRKLRVRRNVTLAV